MNQHECDDQVHGYPKDTITMFKFKTNDANDKALSR